MLTTWQSSHGYSMIQLRDYIFCGPQAVIVEDRMLRIIGSGAVYVADGQGITYTNVSEITPTELYRFSTCVCTFYRTARFSISKVDARTVWRGQSEALDYFSSRLTRNCKTHAERQACKPALVRAQVLSIHGRFDMNVHDVRERRKRFPGECRRFSIPTPMLRALNSTP